MGARVFWKSEARRCVPLSETGVQGRSQDTTLSASEWNSPRHPFLIPIVTRNTKQLRKGQNKTWTEAEIPCINLTHSQFAYI